MLLYFYERGSSLKMVGNLWPRATTLYSAPQASLAVKAKGKLTHNENGQKMRLQCKQRNCTNHDYKPDTKKTGDSSNAKCLFVCTGH